MKGERLTDKYRNRKGRRRLFVAREPRNELLVENDHPVLHPIVHQPRRANGGDRTGFNDRADEILDRTPLSQATRAPCLPILRHRTLAAPGKSEMIIAY